MSSGNDLPQSDPPRLDPCHGYLYPFAEALRLGADFGSHPRTPILEASRAICGLSHLGWGFADPDRDECGYTNMVHYLEMEYSLGHAQLFQERVGTVFNPDSRKSPIDRLAQRLMRVLERSRHNDDAANDHPDMPSQANGDEMQHGMSDHLRMEMEEMIKVVGNLATYLENLGDSIVRHRERANPAAGLGQFASSASQSDSQIATENTRNLAMSHDTTSDIPKTEKRKKRAMNTEATDCARIFREKDRKGENPRMKTVVKEYVDSNGGSVESIIRVLNDNPDQWKKTT